MDISILTETARQAGTAILKVYAEDFSVDTKADDSPLTQADRDANAVIVRALEEHYPEIPIISEETRLTPYEERKGWERFWLVDPLDGTKEFIKKNGEFTVNIALIENGIPVVGVVYQPVGDILYTGIVGKGAWKSVENGEAAEMSGGPHYSTLESVKVVASRSHMTEAVTDFVAALEAQGKQVECISSGSSLKLCLVAAGEADVYPRFGPTMEWDTAAAHAVASAAGRQVVDHDTGKSLCYNKENLLNPWFIVE